jgi:hypothetical protein
VDQSQKFDCRIALKREYFMFWSVDKRIILIDQFIFNWFALTNMCDHSRDN